MLNNTSGRMKTSHLLAFSAPYFVTALIHGPVSGILPTLIVKYYGVEMAAMGTILLVSRMFDGITDPLVGFLSDRTHSPIGRRKPWIIAGFALVMIAVSQLFMPPATAGSRFFLIWIILITLGWTVAEVPYGAWVPEMTGDYNERTRIQTIRSAVALLGGLAFSAAPLLPMFETNEMTPQVFRMVGWVILIALPPAVFAALVLNREGTDVSVRDALTVKDLINSVKGNRPFQLFMVLNVTGGLGIGITSALGFMVFDVYLGIGDKFAQIMIPGAIASVLSLPLWLKITGRIGKTRAFAVSNLLAFVLSLYLPFIEPGPSAYWPYLFIALAQNVAFGAYSVVPLPILADIIDYDILKTGANRAGQYLSALTLLLKCNGAIGGAVAFFMLGIFGFDVKNTVHSQRAINGLLFTFVAIPFILGVLTAVLAWYFPINKHRQEIIRKRIEQRAIRNQRDEAKREA